jgi:hypothetical protein
VPAFLAVRWELRLLAAGKAPGARGG